VVRMCLVPALMSILGDRAWWIPRWLDRILPKLDIEGTGATSQPPRSDAPPRVREANRAMRFANLLLRGRGGAQ
jgi:putative drug exporter of the RND superfamily